jgi:hypothetical protein
MRVEARAEPMPKSKNKTKGTALSALAGIEYQGVAGASLPCEAAVVRLLQCGVAIPKVRILTSGIYHALLLETEVGDLIAIKSGFASGYGGTGPNAFSNSLQLLVTHGAELEEYPVTKKVLERLDRSALRLSDLEAIDASHPIRPSRCYEYILERHFEQARAGELWQYAPPVIPYALIDPRLMDLALEFWGDPNARLHQGYCRLEDAVRARIGSDKHGSKLFSQAFVDKACKLTWPVGDPGEATGRGQLFANAFQAYRNPRAHRENPRTHQLLEFLLLNHLFRLEAEAEDAAAPETTPISARPSTG